MAVDIAFRRANETDSRTCFELFRRSLWDLLRRKGYVPLDEPDPDLDAQWVSYQTLFEHLGGACAEWWIAEDAAGRPIGYARSFERDGLLELTEFFVAGDARVAGVGRALLERAFPPGQGTHRSIIATLDAPAVALYLRFGVSHQTTAVGFAGRPTAVDLPEGYQTATATADDVLAIERDVLGHARPPEVDFMLGDRPAVLLRHGDRTVGYVFLANAHDHAGPVAVRDPAHLPAALAALEQAAYESEVETLEITVPLAATTAVDWLMAQRGFRIDPFYCLFLADGPWARFDRYLPFNPCLFL